jgi:hypothetical protein
MRLGSRNRRQGDRRNRQMFLKRSGSTWVSAVDSEGRTIFVADAHRGDGKRFIVRSDQKLTAFLELERITHELAVSALLGDDSNSLCP